jgi:hypothetical protein
VQMSFVGRPGVPDHSFGVHMMGLVWGFMEQWPVKHAFHVK